MARRFTPPVTFLNGLTGRSFSAEHLPEAGQHAVGVAARPVDPTAARAAHELALRAEDALREQLLHLVLGPGLQPRVALEAAREPLRLGRRQPELLHRLQ